MAIKKIRLAGICNLIGDLDSLDLPDHGGIGLIMSLPTKFQPIRIVEQKLSKLSYSFKAYHRSYGHLGSLPIKFQLDLIC